MDVRRLHGLAQPAEQMPLPLLPQHGIRHVLQMHPLLGLPIPAAAGGDAVQMRVVLPVAAVGLDHHDVATGEVATTDPAIDIIQTTDPTAHERTQHRVRLLIKRLPEDLRHREDNMPIDDALMEHPAYLADPVVHADLSAA